MLQKSAGKQMYSIRAESALVPLSLVILLEVPRVADGAGPTTFALLAQAITKQELFVEVLYNGVPMALPGCQDNEWSCTLEAFLVRRSGLALGWPVQFFCDACMF